MSKKITFNEDFLETNLEEFDVVLNTYTDEYFTVDYIDLDEEEAELTSLNDETFLILDLTDCEDFEIMTDER